MVALVPVVRVLLQDQTVTGCPRLQDVGPSTDRVAVVLITFGFPCCWRLNGKVRAWHRQYGRQGYRRIVQIVKQRKLFGGLYVAYACDIEPAAAFVAGIFLAI